MSFRVACQNGSCGKDCTALKTNNVQILSCNSADGDIVCRERYDPSANCNGCLHNLNFSTDCSTCLEPYFDPDTNCTACLPGYDEKTNCSTCLNTNYDPSTNCTTCLSSYDPVTNCTTCLDSRFDPDNDCTSCLLEGLDPLTNCTQCLPNRDLSTNCTTCTSGYTGEKCVLGELVNTSQRDFTVMLCITSAKHPSKAQYHTVNVMTTPPDLSPTAKVMVGAIAGGVVAVMVIAILVLTVVVILLACLRKRSNKNAGAIKGEAIYYRMHLPQA